MNYEIKIYKYADDPDAVDQLAEVLGPFDSERKADRAEDGVNRQLNHMAYYTEMIRTETTGPV